MFFVLPGRPKKATPVLPELTQISPTSSVWQRYGVPSTLTTQTTATQHKLHHSKQHHVTSFKHQGRLKTYLNKILMEVLSGPVMCNYATMRRWEGWWCDTSRQDLTHILHCKDRELLLRVHTDHTVAQSAHGQNRFPRRGNVHFRRSAGQRFSINTSANHSSEASTAPQLCR